jgi:hypothetical protein
MRDEDGDTLEDRAIARLEKRILALEKALRPFAQLGEKFALSLNSDGSRDGCPLPNSGSLTLGDCRRAAELLKEAPRV